MKKLLAIATLFSIILVLPACGASEEEKKAEQQENEAIINEKVNEIMQKLEASAAAQDTNSAPSDSATSMSPTLEN